MSSLNFSYAQQFTADHAENALPTGSAAASCISSILILVGYGYRELWHFWGF